MEKRMDLRGIIGVFAYACCGYAGNLTMGVLAYIQSSYPGQELIIPYVLTTPAVVSTFYAFILGKLNEKISAKYLAIFGQLCYFAYGMLFFLLGGRVGAWGIVALGGLVGLNQGSNVTMIGIMLHETVPDEGKRNTLTGMVMGLCNLGGVFFSIAGGAAAAAGVSIDPPHGWRISYLLFFIFLITICIQFVCLPKLPPTGNMGGKAVGSNEPNTNANSKVPFKVWVLSFHYFWFFMWTYVYATNCSEYVITTHKLGGGTEAGLASSCLTISGLFAGFLFGAYSKVLRKATIPFVMFVTFVGLILPYIFHSLPTLYASGLCTGFAMSAAQPYIMGYMGEIVPEGAYTKAMGIFSGFMNFGMVVAIPLIQAMTRIIFGDGTDVNKKFLLASIGSVIVFFASIPLYMTKEKTK